MSTCLRLFEWALSLRAGTWIQFTVILIAMGSPTFSAGQGADDCASATPVGDGQFNADTTTATDDAELPCGSQLITPDVHFAYTASCDGLLNANTCVSTDPSHDSICP